MEMDLMICSLVHMVLFHSMEEFTLCLEVILHHHSTSQQHQHQMEQHGLESIQPLLVASLAIHLALSMQLKVVMLTISLLVLHTQTLTVELDISFIIQHARVEQLMEIVHNALVDMDSIQQQEHAHHALSTHGVMEQHHVSQSNQWTDAQHTIQQQANA